MSPVPSKLIWCYRLSSHPPRPLPHRDGDENIDASNDPEPIMVGEEEATCNPACQAILANEVGLASADFQDDRLRTG